MLAPCVVPWIICLDGDDLLTIYIPSALSLQIVCPQTVNPQQDRQQGRNALSSAHMLLLEQPRAQLRSTVESADQGDIAAARFHLLKVFSLLLSEHVDYVISMLMTDMNAGLQLLDDHEEVLLHVFGGRLPLCYDLGAYAPCGMDCSRLRIAFVQVDQFLKVHLSVSLRLSG